MHFQLKRSEVDLWLWELQTASGEKLARAPGIALTEAESRKQIAAFRKAAGGVKFAKVLSP